MNSDKLNKLIELISDRDVQESLKEIIPGKLQLLNKIKSDIHKSLYPSKYTMGSMLEQITEQINKKSDARDLLEDELKDKGLYSYFERRFFYHIGHSPTVSINIDKGLDVFLEPKAFSLSHEELWSILRLIKGVHINNIDLEIE